MPHLRIVSDKPRVYTAGPMTGIPHFNFPVFIEAAIALRAKGYDVVSPVELDDEESRERAMASLDGSPIHYESGATWGDFLARDVKLIADDRLDAIVVLPGWEESKGARLETFVGFLCGISIYDLDMKGIPAWRLVRAWAGELWDIVMSKRGGVW